jgi:hypothetical protein
MSDVFGAQPLIGDSWRVEGAILTLPDGGEDLVVTTIQLGYARATQKFTSLTSRKKHIVVGDGDGNCTLGTIIGPSRGIIKFIKKYSDPCQMKSNVLTIQPAGPVSCEGTGNVQPLKFTCTGVLLSGISLSGTAQAGQLSIISGGLSFSFISLEIDEA